MATNTNQYPELIKLLTQIGKATAETYKQNLKEKNKFATGKLYNSINYRVEVTTTGVKLYFVADKYYLNIENGRKAGGKMPSVEVIKRWMAIKGIRPRNRQSINQTAFMISRSIQRKGIKPNPFLRNIKNKLSDWRDEIKLAIEDDLKVETTSKLKSSIKNSKHIKFK